jgi:uncharacterized protein with FMN-binding domain
MRKIIVAFLMVGLLFFTGMTVYQYQTTEPAQSSCPQPTETTEETGTTTTAETVMTPTSCQYMDGTYTGVGTGKTTGMQVSVTIAGDKITQVSVVASRDDEEYLVEAVNGLIPQILSTQSTAVDTVSGATRSSKGILQGVDDALTQARVQ